MLKKFPIYIQLDSMDCGPTCLRIIAKYYGKNFSLQSLRDKCHINREGVSLLGISDAAEKIGFRTIGVKINSDYPFMHLLYSQLLVCQRVCLQNTVCLICK